MKTLEFYDGTQRKQITIYDDGGIRVGYQFEQDGEWWDFNDSGASLSASEFSAVLEAMKDRE